MREELTYLGIKELLTDTDVDETMKAVGDDETFYGNI